MSKHVKKEFKNALEAYLEGYFSLRDKSKVFELLSDKIRGFGTGIQEKTIDTESYKKLFEHDFETVKDPITYKTYHLDYYHITEDVVIAMFENDIEFCIEGQDIIINHIRQSIVLRKESDKVVIDHIHASLPSTVQGDNESFPVLQVKDIVNQFHKSLQENNTLVNEEVKDLERLVTKDYLTGLDNRYKIDQFINTEIKRANRFNATFSMILMDIDRFKELNDKLGHLEGDQYLKDISQVLISCAKDTDLVGRWGGDEFAMILPQVGMYEVSDYLQGIKEKIHKRFEGEISLSYGISTFVHGDDQQSLFARADKNLYKDKKTNG